MPEGWAFDDDDGDPYDPTEDANEDFSDHEPDDDE